MPLVLTLLFSMLVAHAKSLDNLYLQNGCSIRDTQGEIIQQYPGLICHFFEDGTFLSYADSKLRLYGKNSEIIWELGGKFHHQLNLSNDGKTILAMTEFPNPKKRMKDEKFLLINREGKIIREAIVSELFKKVRLNETYSPYVVSHFNSFYQIPKLNTDRELPAYLKEGNFVANSYKQGIFFLSADLSTILHRIVLPHSELHRTHDVQVLASGNLLYFNNTVNNSHPVHSSIDEYDPLSKEIVFQFTAEPKPMFFSLHCGGVQQLNEDEILFSHMLAGTYIYSKKSKTIIFNSFQTHMSNGVFYPSQQVKAVNVRDFLSQRK